MVPVVMAEAVVWVVDGDLDRDHKIGPDDPVPPIRWNAVSPIQQPQELRVPCITMPIRRRPMAM